MWWVLGVGSLLVIQLVLRGKPGQASPTPVKQPTRSPVPLYGRPGVWRQSEEDGKTIWTWFDIDAYGGMSEASDVQRRQG